MKKLFFLIAVVGPLFGALAAQAGTVYVVDRTIGAGGVSGTIETDGTIGALEVSNILDWYLTISDGVDQVEMRGPLSDPSTSSTLFFHSDFLVASQGELILNYDLLQRADNKVFAFVGYDRGDTWVYQEFDYGAENATGTALVNHYDATTMLAHPEQLQSDIISPVQIATAQTPSIVISVAGGTSLECTLDGAAVIESEASTFSTPEDPISFIEWFLDGGSIGSGYSVSQFAPLGNHTLSVVATLESGESVSDSVEITIEDTTPPTGMATFLDKQGNAITEITRAGMTPVKVDLEAFDVCDPNPLVAAFGGVPVFDLSTIQINASTDKVTLEAADIRLSVEAIDASGNSSKTEVLLPIVE